MSKQVKDIITNEIADRLKDIEGVGVINPRGINAIKNNQMRRRLHEKGLKMTVVRNTLAKRAVKDGSKLKGFDVLLEGPSAVVYGKTSIANVARVLLDEKKNDETIELRGIFFDGESYPGEKGVEQASKLPTREEAIGALVALMLGPGRRLGGLLQGQAGKIAALLKAIEEKAKERGESAAPAAEAASTEAAAAAPAPAAS